MLGFLFRFWLRMRSPQGKLIGFAGKWKIGDYSGSTMLHPAELLMKDGKDMMMVATKLELRPIREILNASSSKEIR